MNIKPKTLCKDCRHMDEIKRYCVAQPIPPDYSPIDGRNMNRNDYVRCCDTKSFNYKGICCFFEKEC